MRTKKFLSRRDPMRWLNLIAGRLGYEVRPRRSESFDAIALTGELAPLLSMTEGMINDEEARLLYKLARDTTGECIVEIGSYRGRSTVALAKGSFDGHRVPVFAIDPHDDFVGVLGGKFNSSDRGAFYKAMLDTTGYHVVRLINLPSAVAAKCWTSRVALLWIDGDHSYEGVKRDFESWLPHLTDDAIIAFDDSLNPHAGVQQFVRNLLSEGRYVKLEVVGKVTVISARRQSE